MTETERLTDTLIRYGLEAVLQQGLAKALQLYGGLGKSEAQLLAAALVFLVMHSNS